MNEKAVVNGEGLEGSRDIINKLQIGMMDKDVAYFKLKEREDALLSTAIASDRERLENRIQREISEERLDTCYSSDYVHGMEKALQIIREVGK